MGEPSPLATRFLAWSEEAPDEVAWTFSTAEGDDTWSRVAIRRAAERTALELLAAGATVGDLVLLGWPTTPEFVAGFWACQLAGTSAVPVPIDLDGSRRGRHAQERLDAILAAHDIRWALTPLAHRELLANRATPVTVVGPSDHPAEGAGSLLGSAAVPALIQFTSGSTLAPRGCVISPAALLENALALGVASGLGAGPTCGVNWCPLFHDMGLVNGVVVPVAVGQVHVVLMAPERFAARPSRWLELIERYEAVITIAPNAALALIARWAERARTTTFDLSALRTVATGAEPVDPNVARRFSAALARWGLPSDAVQPAYGLAEATVGVTFASQGLRTINVDRTLLEEDSRAVEVAAGDATIEAVSVGKPLRSIDLRVMMPEGVGRDGDVGEVQVLSPSLCDGYLGDEEASAALWDGDWLRTGDIGFLVDGDLFVVGRAKDMLVVAGRNIAPQDVERVAESVAAVRAGATVAFGSERVRSRGTDGVVLVVEGLRGAEDVVDELRSAVSARLGVALIDVVVVSRGGIPRTTSGKVRRRRCRELYESGALRS